MLECQNHDDYQGAMRWLISFVEGYVQRALNTAGTVKQSGLTSGVTDVGPSQCTVPSHRLINHLGKGSDSPVLHGGIAHPS